MGHKLLHLKLLSITYILIFYSVFLVHCDAAAAATTKAPPTTPAPTTTAAPNKCLESGKKTLQKADSAELTLPIPVSSPAPNLSSVCIEFDYHFVGVQMQPVDVLGSLELIYNLSNHAVSLTTLQLNTWRPLSDAKLCLANYVANVESKEYSLSLKLHLVEQYYSNLCYSWKVTYQVVSQNAIDFLLPFGDASNPSTPDSALNELESMVPEETVEELWHSQWNDAYLQFEDYFEFESKSIRFSSSMNIRSSSSSGKSMTTRLSTKWILLTDSLKKNSNYLYRLSNALLNGHHLKVYPVVCNDQGLCIEADLGNQKSDLMSADVHFSLPNQLISDNKKITQLFRLEFVFEFTFQNEAAASTSISVDLSLLDSSHPCYYFNQTKKLIIDRRNRCTHNGICKASTEVQDLNWKCLCPTGYWGVHCEVTDFCHQRLFRDPKDKNKLLTGTEVCTTQKAGNCVNRAFNFSCDCGGDSDYSWRPNTLDCRLVPLCPKAQYRDICDSVSQVCVEPTDGKKKVTCRCAPGYVNATNGSSSCRKPNACSPSPCGLNTECLPVFNSLDDFTKDLKNRNGPAICYCKKGYVKDEKETKSTGKLTCKKPNPCDVGGELHPPCMQVCSATENGNGHRCSCFSGYQPDSQATSKCVIKSGSKSLCKNAPCTAPGSWCDEKIKECICKDGFDYTLFEIPKTNKTTDKIFFCKVNPTMVHDAECPNGKLINNPNTGTLECNCKGVFELDPKKRVCKLKPICSAGAEGEKDCSKKKALCLITDKAAQIQASSKSSTTTPKTIAATTAAFKSTEKVFQMSDMYTCSCKPGQHRVFDEKTGYKCVDLCEDTTITKKCSELNAVCNSLAALSVQTNDFFNYTSLEWKSICLCQEGLVRKDNTANCTLPQFTNPFSSYNVHLNFSKESYQLLYQFKEVIEKQLHQVALSDGAFLSQVQEQVPPENFKQLVNDYRSSVNANEAIVKKQVDERLALLVGRRLLDLALNRMVEQYMAQLVAHSQVSITTKDCSNAEKDFVACKVEIVVANEAEAAGAIDGGNLVQFFKKQFSEYCVDDDDGDVCMIAIAGVTKKDVKKTLFLDFLEEDEFENEQTEDSLTNVTEPISLILSKKSVEKIAFAKFDFCQNSKCPQYTECHSIGSSYECNCKYSKDTSFSIFYKDPTATQVSGYLALVHKCIAKKSTDICAHYAEQFAENHHTNRSYFIIDDACFNLTQSSDSPLATVHFNCSQEGWSVATNASTEELQDGFVHVKNYCVNKIQFICGTHDCSGANGQCEVNKENEPSCRCKDGWVGNLCQTKESFWYMIGLIIAGSLMLLILIANTAWCILHKRRKRSRSRPRHSNSLYSLNRGDSKNPRQQKLEKIEMSHYEMNGTYRRHESPSLPNTASTTEHLPPRFTIVSTTERGNNSRGDHRRRMADEEDDVEMDHHRGRDHRSRSRRETDQNRQVVKATKSAPSKTTAPKKAYAGKSKSSAAVKQPYTISSRRETVSTSSDSSSTDSSLDLPPSRPPSLPPSPVIPSRGGNREAAHSASSSSSAGATASASSSDKPVILTRSMLLGNGGQSDSGNAPAKSTSTKQTSFQYVPSNLRNRSTDAVGGDDSQGRPRASGRASKTPPSAYPITNPAVNALQSATKDIGQSNRTASSKTSSSTRNRNYD